MNSLAHLQFVAVAIIQLWLMLVFSAEQHLAILTMLLFRCLGEAACQKQPFMIHESHLSFPTLRCICLSWPKFVSHWF